MKLRFCPGYLPTHCDFRCDQCRHVVYVETDSPILVDQYIGTPVEVPSERAPMLVPQGTRLPVAGHGRCEVIKKSRLSIVQVKELPHRKKQVRWRRCLKCSKRFRSEGPWNRLCDKCNASNKGVKDLPSAAPRRNGQPMW